MNGRGVVATDAELTVGFSVDSTPADLCTPAVTGGYLSHLNQAIRVQVADPNTSRGASTTDLACTGSTCWPIARPSGSARSRSTNCIGHAPVRWSNCCRGGRCCPNGEVQAGSTGAFAVVDQSFDPDADELTLTAAVPNFGELDWVGRPDQAVLEADGRWMYLRVWERDDDTSGPTLPLVPGGDAVHLGTTGLQVTFTGTERARRPLDHRRPSSRTRPGRAVGLHRRPRTPRSGATACPARLDPVEQRRADRARLPPSLPPADRAAGLLRHQRRRRFTQLRRRRVDPTGDRPAAARGWSGMRASWCLRRTHCDR